MEDIRYLNKVLNNWREFCKSHKKMERDIKNLIEENKRLKEEIEILRGCK